VFSHVIELQRVFDNTGGSVLMAILTHATWNTFYSAAIVEVFPAPAVVGSIEFDLLLLVAHPRHEREGQPLALSSSASPLRLRR
jgi:hypothetical protein